MATPGVNVKRSSNFLPRIGVFSIDLSLIVELEFSFYRIDRCGFRDRDLTGDARNL
jgi:hypothetical protein